MMRALVGLIVLLLIAAGAVYTVARRETVPIVRIEQPDKAIGQAGTLVVTAEAPKAQFKALTVTVEQNGKSIPLFSLDSPDQAKAAATSQAAPNRITVTRPIGEAERPRTPLGNRAHRRLGDAAVVPEPAHALGERLEETFKVRLEPPAIAVLSTHHYVNLGGSEMVVYRATPADVHSGVRVGDVEFPGFPRVGRGCIAGADPSVRVAFFALLYNQGSPTVDKGNTCSETWVTVCRIRHEVGNAIMPWKEATAMSQRTEFIEKQRVKGSILASFVGCLRSTGRQATSG